MIRPPPNPTLFPYPPLSRSPHGRCGLRPEPGAQTALAAVNLRRREPAAHQRKREHSHGAPAPAAHMSTMGSSTATVAPSASDATRRRPPASSTARAAILSPRSEEHTSE